ncbi:MAG: amidohydrolase [Thermomicrobiales bacterium]|nr:amidohydrolase [Thermomicrobiales bacterium]
MTLRIEATWLFDGTGAAPLADGAVLIDDNRIVASGLASEVPPGDESLAFLGCTLMPGLVDAHTHLSFNMGEQPVGSLERGSAVHRALQATRYLRQDLDAGVTLVRVVGEMEFLDATVKDAVAAGTIAGPRLVIATRSLAATNGHGGEWPGNAVDGVDEMRKAVRTNLRRGADLTKLLVTGSVDHPGGHFACGFSRDEIAVAVEESHRAGKPVAAHAVRPDDVRICVEEGVDAIEHGHILDAGAIELMRQRNTWLVATLAIVLDEELLAPDLAANPLFAEVEWLPRRAAAPTAYREAIAAGIRWACGTDAMHGRMADEVTALVEIGIPATSVLVAATRSGAEICGLGSSLGTLEPGKLADLLIVDGNPVEDVAALRSVRSVLKDGRVVFRHFE